MMAAKLEWVRDANGWWHAPRSCGAKGGYWSINVDNEGRFYLAGRNGDFASLPDAKDYCEQQEREAAPPAESPQPGDVWGVPGKLETRRMFGGLDHDGEFVKWYGPHNRGVDSVEQWQSWLTSTGAVRIDGEGKHDSQWREELATFTDLLEYAKSELDAERARVVALEAEVADLKKQPPGGRKAGERIKHLEKRLREVVEERDGLRAARGRLLEALRGIEGTTIYCRDNPLVKLAREAIKREEGVKS